MTVIGNITDTDYSAYLRRVSDRLATNLAAGPVFTTNVGDILWELYIKSFDSEEDRQHHTCRCCKNFITRYGGLVTINDDGSLTSAVWAHEDAPLEYLRMALQLKTMVEMAPVTGVFLTKETTLGTPVTGPWTHLHGHVPVKARLKGYRTPSQVVAEKLEDFNMLNRAIQAYSVATATHAVALLESNSLYRSEKVAGPARFFLECAKIARDTKNPKAVHHRIWKQVATAGAGFCHVNSSMIGTLLQDIEAGLPLTDVQAKFDAKMNPNVYARPQAAPKAGNIRQGEKIIQQMGLERSLERRYAQVEEIDAIWTPRPAQKGGSGVFAHLEPKAAKKANPLKTGTAKTKITFTKFRDEIMPKLSELSLQVPSGMNPYVAITTGVNADAPSLFQWDHQFAWYVYTNGSLPTDWNLRALEWVNVTAITLNPAKWDGREAKNFANSAVFILEGARDASRFNPTLAIFPETLKPELHSVRSTIEAFSAAGTLQDRDMATACGIVGTAGANGDWPITVRAVSDGIERYFVIDRWD